MKETLIQLSKGVQSGPASDLVPVLFGERQPSVSNKDIKFTLINKNLDHSQVFPTIFIHKRNAYISLGSDVHLIVWDKRPEICMYSFMNLPMDKIWIHFLHKKRHEIKMVIAWAV